MGAVADRLPETRVEVDAGVGAGSAVPWELLRDPSTDGVLALRAGAFVRTHPGTPVPVRVPGQGPGGLRVLLVICRPGGREDVPFRSVASHLVRLSRQAREAFRLDVLRPPTFAELGRVLEAAKNAGEPYQVVHFDLGNDPAMQAVHKLDLAGQQRHGLKGVAARDPPGS